jgi:LuxR family maltose regulon positive regulatory protein
MSRTVGDVAILPSVVQAWSERLDTARFVIPHPPTGLVRRDRLFERLDEGARNGLTLVTAPAGTGKSVLLSSWAAAQRAARSVVWLSLDDDCAGAGRFWHLVGAGLSHQGVDVLLPSESPGPEAGEPSFLAALANRIVAHHVPVVLVLDCDCALSTDAASGLDLLVRRCADRLRVVLAARQDPPLPLHRYRLAGTVVELRMADLAFTSSEARELLSGLGVELSPASLDAVTCRTQGWAAGLRMAAMSLVHRPNREVVARRLAGDTGILSEYLLAEVLDTQPEGVRLLLLETSVVDVLRPGLVSALAGPSADRAISFLVRGNAFLEELPDSPGCYRYHLLFRELLRAQLAYEFPERLVELHRVAAAWSADHGLVVDAVRHAIATQDWETACRYVVDDQSIAALLTGRPEDPLTDVLSAIPRTAAGIAISLVSAARALAAGDLPGASAEVARIPRPIKTADGHPWPEGELAASLLDQVCGQLTGGTPQQPGVVAKRGIGELVQPLTVKEQEVLEHLSELLTTEEIASKMFISVNTVRTHIRNILRKLSASRRNEAVRRARVLKIIPS